MADGEQHHRRPAKRPRLEAAAAGEAAGDVATSSSTPQRQQQRQRHAGDLGLDVVASPSAPVYVETPKPTAAAFAGMSPAAAALLAAAAAEAEADSDSDSDDENATDDADAEPSGRGNTTTNKPTASSISNEELGFVLYVRWFGTAGQTKLNRLPLRELRAAHFEDDLGDLPRDLVESQFPERARMPHFCTDAASYARFTPRVECLALPGDVVRTEVRLALTFRGWEYTVVKQGLAPPGTAAGAPPLQQQRQYLQVLAHPPPPLGAANANRNTNTNNQQHHQQQQQPPPRQQPGNNNATGNATAAASSTAPERPLPTLCVMAAEFQGSDPLMAALGLRVSMVAYPMVALRRQFLESTAAQLRADPGAFRGLL